MSVVVIGGGIVGLFSAFYLRSEGVDVVVIEQGDLGGWSRAAAGLLEFTRYEINRINVWSYPLRYLRMVSRGDARIRTWDSKWLATYLRVWGREPPQEMWGVVKTLSEFSRNQYRAFAEARNDFEYSEEPEYEVGLNIEEALSEAKKDPLSPRVEVGEYRGRPALIYLDAVKISTDLFIERILRELQGVQFIRRRAQDVRDGEVLLDGGDVLRADAVLVAAGYWARKFGVPVAPFKGYGFRIRARLDRMVSDNFRGVFAVPFTQWTKVTSRFDLDGTEDHSPAQRVLERAREFLGDFEVIDMAVGYRPCAPDGFPIVDKLGSVVVVTGGCRLGWTLGPALGKLAADLALDRQVPQVLSMVRFRV